MKNKRQILIIIFFVGILFNMNFNRINNFTNNRIIIHKVERYDSLRDSEVSADVDIDEEKDEENDSFDDKEDTSFDDSSKIDDIVIINTSNINLSDYSSDIKITKGGVYNVFGVLKNTLYIETEEEVLLNLDNVKITAKDTSAIVNILNNDLVIHLNEGTVNTLSDGGKAGGLYDGCIYSNGKIIIEGEGELIVKGQQGEGEGISTKNAPITINSGKINIISVDDGINTGGDGGTITINGGNILINAGGDGVDSNQDIVINGGIIYSVGSANGADSGLDANNDVKVNGGILIATGASEIGPISIDSKQNSIMFAFSKLKQSDKLITLVDENYKVIVSFISYDAFSTLLISTSALKDGKYYLYQDGINTGTIDNGIYYDGVYEKGNILDIDGNTEFIVDGNINGYSTINSLNIDEEDNNSDIYKIVVNGRGGTSNILSSAKVGEYVFLDIIPDKGSTIREIIVRDVEGNNLEIIDDGFIMPASNVEIDVYYDFRSPETSDISVIIILVFGISFLIFLLFFVLKRV